MRAVGAGVAALLCLLFVSFSPSPSNAVTFASYGNRTGPPLRLPYDRNFTKTIRGLSPAFHITYPHSTSAKARKALEHAIKVQIRIKFVWKNTGKYNLGSAGPTAMHTWNGGGSQVPRALWIQLNAGAANPYDVPNTDDPPYEIEATFNSHQKWYFGTDGKTKKETYDFVSVVMHELLHGMGFTSWLDYVGGSGHQKEFKDLCGKGSKTTMTVYTGGRIVNYNTPSSQPVAFFSHIYDKAKRNIAQTYGTQGDGVLRQLTDNDCYFKDYAGKYHSMFCPTDYIPGSSGASHQAPLCGNLMSPTLMWGDSTHSFGAVDEILATIGYQKGSTGSVIPASRAKGTGTTEASNPAIDDGLEGTAGGPSNFCEECDKCSTCIAGECVWTVDCGNNACYECNPDTGRCDAPIVHWSRNCEYCDPAVGVRPKPHCDSNPCFSCNAIDGTCTNPRLPECPFTPDPDWMNSQHWECNDWECRGGTCTYFGNPANQCDKYQWPLDQPLKDWQCWQPLCVGNGAYADCRGTPSVRAPLQCPVPVGIDKYCYVYECESPGTGYCSKEFFKSKGGPLPGDEHAGNCPVPPQYDPRCYWPYCDMTGNCKGDILTGTKYTRDGNFLDGTQGIRTVPYTIRNIPFGTGEVTYAVAECKPEDSRDEGNLKYSEWNPDCFKARCEAGRCGGDGVNWDEPCRPVDGRATGGYNEVFVGAPNWPGVTDDCVYYTCGSKPGEFGHCIQRNKAGQRQTPCHNSDNDKCTNDWCDGLGMCKDHEWVQGHSEEGRCVKHACDPATGIFTFERNGDVCCGNGELNTGEECEPGLDGADEHCCARCYIQSSCDDGKICTDDACSDKHACVSTFDATNVEQCPPLDLTVADNRCRRRVCSESVDCATEADPKLEGHECDASPDTCNHFVCRSGSCISEPNNIGNKCETKVGPGAESPELISADMTCHSLTCQQRYNADGVAEGKCVPTPDDSLPCDADTNLCTSDVCQKGKCVLSHKTECAPMAEPCYAAGVCIPSTGKCEYKPLSEGTLCTPPSFYPAAHPFDRCQFHICNKDAKCVRHPEECRCGNNKLDDGEVCDWSVSAYRDCCTPECTGCSCGNGVIEENLGEECDWGIADQHECCDSKCKGCLCGNGRLDPGEECDATAPRDSIYLPYCCQTDCTACESEPVRISQATGTVAAVSFLVLGLAAGAVLLYVLYVRNQARIVPAAPTNPLPAGAANDNPFYASPVKENPIFQAAP